MTAATGISSVKLWMINPKDSVFHVVYPFDYWIYEEWSQNWTLLTQNKYDPNVKQFPLGILVDTETSQYKKVQSFYG